MLPQLLWPDTGLGVGVAVTTREQRGWPSGSAGFDIGAATAGPAAAAQRAALQQRLGLPELRWMEQVHGNRVLRDADWLDNAPGPADAQCTGQHSVGLAVQVADCVPVVLARRDGAAVAVAHAGWRGLVAGVLDAAVVALGGAAAVQAWVGPAICAEHYEVGDEVAGAVQALGLALPTAVLRRGRPGHWQLDMPGLAKVALLALGVSTQGGGQCNRCRPERWWSHRGRAEYGAGRFAVVAWLPAR